MNSEPAQFPTSDGVDAEPAFRACSGLESYDRALFYGAPPIHGPVKKSDFGYAAMFQPKLRRVTEVEAGAGPDLIVLMIMSAAHRTETWMAGEYRKIDFRRGDLVIIPPYMDTRWCASDGQASAMHLHVSTTRLADACADDAFDSVQIIPRLGFRDTRLAQIMRAAARLDELDPLISLKVAALGAAALLRIMRQ